MSISPTNSLPILTQLHQGKFSRAKVHADARPDQQPLASFKPQAQPEVRRLDKTAVKTAVAPQAAPPAAPAAPEAPQGQIIPPTAMFGDLDGDGNVNAWDLALLLGEWGEEGGLGDINHDGTVNEADMNILFANWGQDVNARLKSEYTAMDFGDFNGDGKVDGMDLAQVLGNWGDVTNENAKLDINGDGKIGELELNTVLGYWGQDPNQLAELMTKTNAVASAPPATPEEPTAADAANPVSRLDMARRRRGHHIFERRPEEKPEVAVDSDSREDFMRLDRRRRMHRMDRPEDLVSYPGRPVSDEAAKKAAANDAPDISDAYAARRRAYMAQQQDEIWLKMLQARRVNQEV